MNSDVSDFKPEVFKFLPEVVMALEEPRKPRSVLNYMCGCDTADPVIRLSLDTEEKVRSLLLIWFASGSSLDALCQPFAPVIRELKAQPPTLIGEDWDSLEGKVAKVLLADQLSRSCFRGTAEAFSYDQIAQKLVRELVAVDLIEETLELPAAFLYLLPWALAHSEDLEDLDYARELIDKAAASSPSFSLFSDRNRRAVEQHRQVLEKFGRYPQRNKQLGRNNTPEEKAWLEDTENLPVWAGGNL